MEASQRSTAGEGWIVFAGVLFLVLATFNLIDGIVALANDRHFVADELFFGDLTSWGIVHLVIGGLQLLAAYLIFEARASGQVLGIFMAGLNLVAQLFFLPAFPIWSVIIMVLDGMVIYGLTVYGTGYE